MPSIPEIIGLIIGGLGLFFIGVRLISANLSLMAGRGFRAFIAGLTKNPYLSGFIGVISGGITQSTSAVTFIMTGMISAGLVTTRKAMPIVLWSNVGNCILVFLAVINFHVMVLYLLGMIGFLYYCDLDKSKLLRPAIGGLLGVTLLFLGLDFMKSGASPLNQIEWFSNMIAHAEKSYLLGLLAAGLLAFISQSAATIAAIAIALANTGILNLESSLMIIYGTNLGPAISTWLLASKLHGSPKQLAIFQVIFKFIGLITLVGLFYLEIASGIPLVAALVKKIAPSLSHQLAIAYLTFQITAALILNTLRNPVAKWLGEKYPDSETDLLSKPRHMYDQALQEPLSALQLLEQEELIVLKRYPSYLDTIREDPKLSQDLGVLHRGTRALNQELDGYFHELINKKLSRDVMEKTLNLQNRMEVLINLEENLYEMAKAPHGVSLTPTTRNFIHAVAEATHTLLLSAADVLKSDDFHDHYFLLRATEDRGDLMEKIHAQMRETNPEIGVREQQVIEIISSRFERIVWMLRYLTKLTEKAYILNRRSAA